jgi:UDP-4-amino-4,6-dideoxy-N-acetyl-beta-L-altrosamine transaminase
MAFIPYSCQDITDDDVAAVVAALRSEYLTQGPRIPAFEKAFAKRHNFSHAVSVSNATAGLHIACLALGVGPGSLVWTTPITFLASANCALYCGADIDFVDMDPATRNMSVDALREKLRLAAKQGRVPNVVVPVDFSGLPCDAREIRALADEYGFKILEDASHAAGATYLDAPVGSVYADVSVFSFHAVKIVTTAEGGIVATQDAALARRVELLRSHGMTREAGEMSREPDGPWYYEQVLLGFNYRMTEVQAALGASQLTRIDALQEQREARVRRYDRLLADLPLILPPRVPDRRSSWHLYAVEVNEAKTDRTRAQVFRTLRDGDVGVNVHYIPVHLQPYYTALGFKRGDYPAAERYYERAITLPLFPAMTDEQQDTVVSLLRKAFG